MKGLFSCILALLLLVCLTLPAEAEGGVVITLEQGGFANIPQGSEENHPKHLQIVPVNAQIVIRAISKVDDGMNAFSMTNLEELLRTMPLSEALGSMRLSAQPRGLGAGSYSCKVRVDYLDAQGVPAYDEAVFSYTITEQAKASSGAPASSASTADASAQALPAGSTPVTPYTSLDGLETATIVNCKNYANVRSGPNMDDYVVGKAMLGERVGIHGRSDDGEWYEVQYENASRVGWVHKSFVEK